MTRLRRFLQLPAGRQLWLVRAYLSLAFVRLLHQRYPFTVTQRTLVRLGRLIAVRATAATTQRAVWAVSVVSPAVRGGDNCFVRALTLQVLLAQHRLDTELRVGFMKSATGTVDGHAWLERDGHVLIGAIEGLPTFRANSRVYPSHRP